MRIDVVQFVGDDVANATSSAKVGWSTRTSALAILNAYLFANTVCMSSIGWKLILNRSVDNVHP